MQRHNDHIFYNPLHFQIKTLEMKIFKTFIFVHMRIHNYVHYTIFSKRHPTFPCQSPCWCGKYQQNCVENQALLINCYNQLTWVDFFVELENIFSSSKVFQKESWVVKMQQNLQFFLQSLNNNKTFQVEAIYK